MIKKLTQAGLVFGLVFVAIPLQAALIITDDFQNDTVGQAPANAHITGTNKVEVVGNSSTPADPFGGSGNQSLVFEGGDDVDWSSGANAITTGIATFSTKFLMSTNSPYDGSAYMTVQAGNNTIGGSFTSLESAAQFYITEGGITVRDGAAWVAIDNDFNNFNLGEVWNIAVDMNVDNQTWTLTINDVVMSDTVVGSTFAFRNSITAINAVAFNGLNGRTQQVFVDDIALVPEPATLGLFGVFGIGIMLVRRIVTR